MKVFIISIMVLIGVKISAQQIIMNSQYMVNSFAINPAAAGTKTFAPLVLDVRRQWAGISEAPVSQQLSYHTNLTSTMGVGGYLYNDVAGPSRRTGLMGALSTQVEVQRDVYLSLGLGVSLTQYILDRSKLVTEEANDNTVDNFTSNLLIPDVSGGVKLYGEYFHLGAALFNGLQTRRDIMDFMTPVTNNLQRTIYLTGSYLYPIGGDGKSASFFIEPSTVLRAMLNAPFQFDVNMRLAHSSGIWTAASYRFQDAIAVIIGYTNDIFGVAYSYDFNTSGLRSYNSGSHEITVTLKGKNKAAAGYSGGKYRVINCPSF